MTQWSSVQSNLLCWDFWEEWAVHCLAYVKWQGCRHQAYKLQTEANKTLQYWLSTILSTDYLQPVYTISTSISTSTVPSTFYWATSSLLHSSWVWRRLTIEWLRWWAWNQANTHFKLVYNTMQYCVLNQTTGVPLPSLYKDLSFFNISRFHNVIHDRK